MPLEQLAAGRKTKLIGDDGGRQGSAVSGGDCGGWTRPDAEKLLVADNLSDDVLLIDAASGAIEKRFDLSESDAVPGTYPVRWRCRRMATRAFVALWNASEIVELDLVKGTVGRKLALLKPSSR